MRLTGSLYGKTIEANNISVLKRKASMISNRYFNACDVMEVTDGTVTFNLYRFNRKYPNNTITYGAWR